MTAESGHTERAPRDNGRLARLVVAAIVVAVVVAIGFDNREEVDVGYLVGDVRAPVWVVLVAAGVAGIIVGWLVKHRPRRHD